MYGVHIGRKSVNLETHTKHKNLHEAIKYESELLNLTSIAFFTFGPMNMKRNAVSYQEIKKYCDEKNISIYIHTSYLSIGVWSVNQKTRNLNKSLLYIRHIKDQLLSGKQCGANGIVLHLPNKSPEVVVETLEVLSDCKVLNSIRKNPGVLPKIVLEMPASKPDEFTYETPDKLNNLCRLIQQNKKITIEWSLCIDTCHQWSGGVDYSRSDGWDNWIAELDDYTRDKIELIHLNGALSKNFGTGKDLHVIPFAIEDALWYRNISDEMRDYLLRTNIYEFKNINFYDKLSKQELADIKNSSIYSLIKFAKKNNISMISEIDLSIFKEAKFAIDVINGLLNEL
jgi:endonuclease IV